MSIPRMTKEKLLSISPSPSRQAFPNSRSTGLLPSLVQTQPTKKSIQAIATPQKKTWKFSRPPKYTEQMDNEISIDQTSPQDLRDDLDEDRAAFGFTGKASSQVQDSLGVEPHIMPAGRRSQVIIPPSRLQDGLPLQQVQLEKFRTILFSNQHQADLERGSQQVLRRNPVIIKVKKNKDYHRPAETENTLKVFPTKVLRSYNQSASSPRSTACGLSTNPSPRKTSKPQQLLRASKVHISVISFSLNTYTREKIQKETKDEAVQADFKASINMESRGTQSSHSKCKTTAMNTELKLTRNVRIGTSQRQTQDAATSPIAIPRESKATATDSPKQANSESQTEIGSEFVCSKCRRQTTSDLDKMNELLSDMNGSPKPRRTSSLSMKTGASGGGRGYFLNKDIIIEKESQEKSSVSSVSSESYQSPRLFGEINQQVFSKKSPGRDVPYEMGYSSLNMNSGESPGFGIRLIQDFEDDKVKEKAESLSLDGDQVENEVLVLPQTPTAIQLKQERKSQFQAKAIEIDMVDQSSHAEEEVNGIYFTHRMKEAGDFSAASAMATSSIPEKKIDKPAHTDLPEATRKGENSQTTQEAKNTSPKPKEEDKPAQVKEETVEDEKEHLVLPQQVPKRKSTQSVAMELALDKSELMREINKNIKEQQQCERISHSGSSNLHLPETSHRDSSHNHPRKRMSEALSQEKMQMLKDQLHQKQVRSMKTKQNERLRQKLKFQQSLMKSKFEEKT